MAEFTRKYLHDHCEGIDAAMFSGDPFMEKANREQLRFYMARWQRHLPVWEKIEAECSTCEGSGKEGRHSICCDCDDTPSAEPNLVGSYHDGYTAGLRDALSKIGDQIAGLKLHPTTSEEYDAGYIGARNDAFAIVQEAADGE